jgi:Flp pilus assembly protein TadD
MPNDKKKLMLKKKHEHALDFFKRGQFAQSAKLLQYLLKQNDKSELWNDWATVQLIRGATEDAERGYRRALELEPSNREAEVNFGILLAATGHEQEATPLLLDGVKSLKGKQRAKITRIIADCKQKLKETKSTA